MRFGLAYFLLILYKFARANLLSLVGSESPLAPLRVQTKSFTESKRLFGVIASGTPLNRIPFL